MSKKPVEDLSRNSLKSLDSARVPGSFRPALSSFWRANFYYCFLIVFVSIFQKEYFCRDLKNRGQLRL